MWQGDVKTEAWPALASSCRSDRPAIRDKVEMLDCGETAELDAVQRSAVGGLWRPALPSDRPSAVRSELMAGRVSVSDECR